MPSFEKEPGTKKNEIGISEKNEKMLKSLSGGTRIFQNKIASERLMKLISDVRSVYKEKVVSMLWRGSRSSRI